MYLGKKMKTITIGDKEFLPKPGQIINIKYHKHSSTLDGKIVKLSECNCRGINVGWPNDLEICGAHIVTKINGEYEKTGFIAWAYHYGWLLDGELVESDIIDLKSQNTSPLATNCCKCGEKLRNPMPGLDIFKHCPKCEP